MINATTHGATAWLTLTGRLLMAAIFLISGIGKLAAPAATIGYIASQGLPFASIDYLAAVVIEIGGALLLMTGYRTRLTAMLLAGFTIATALVFHHAIGDQNQLIHLLKNLAMAGGLLQVAASGAGALSVDACLNLKRNAAPGLGRA
jgi:putative oxidoreductase